MSPTATRSARRGASRWRASGLAAATVLLLAPTDAFAKADEAELMAAFTIKLAEFVSWPEAALAEGDAFVLGLVGEGPVPDALSELPGRMAVRGHPVVTRRLGSASAPDRVHALFVSGAGGPVPEVPHRLTVGQGEGFIESGGMVEVAIHGGRLVFQVNLPALERAGLRMSARALRLAERVHR